MYRQQKVALAYNDSHLTGYKNTGRGREIYQQQNALLAYDNNQLTGSKNIDKRFEILEGKIHEKRF